MVFGGKISVKNGVRESVIMPTMGDLRRMNEQMELLRQQRDEYYNVARKFRAMLWDLQTRDDSIGSDARLMIKLSRLWFTCPACNVMRNREGVCEKCD